MKQDRLLNKLESVKQIGMYSIQLSFGSQDVGADDLSTPTMGRPLMLLAWPVGCLGETKILFRGTVANFMEFNFAQRPTIIGNPPKEHEYEKDGYYLWGTDRMVEEIAEKLSKRKP